ncbi:MAG: PIN domain-containing protein [Syntrophobacteraceae bacterium]|jgi:predicted nucleic acid-binding protein
MILIDTGPLVALFDASDNYHRICLDILKDIDGPLITVRPVLTEAFYLLNFSWKAQDNLWEYLARGGIEVDHLERSAGDRCRALMSKYRDLPMDLADAALVTIAEAKKIKSIFTLDHKDFSLYRPSHIKRFELIPKQPS